MARHRPKTLLARPGINLEACTITRRIFIPVLATTDISGFIFNRSSFHVHPSAFVLPPSSPWPRETLAANAVIGSREDHRRAQEYGPVDGFAVEHCADRGDQRQAQEIDGHD